MAGITALGTTYNLPNYTGILYQLTPADTPFFSAIGGLTGGGQCNSNEFEWETFDLRAAAQNVALEGADAPTPQERVRANVSNIVQIHQEAVSISYTKLAATQAKAGINNAETNPVGNELDWQVSQMIKQMLRDIEYSFLRGVYQKPSDNTTARKTRGLLTAITTNTKNAGTAVAATTQAAADTITKTAHGLVADDQVVFDTIVTTTGISADTVYYVSGTVAANTFQVSATKGGAAIDLTGGDGTLNYTKSVVLSTSLVEDILQLTYDNGGLAEAATATIMVGSAQKRAISEAYASAYGKYQEMSRTVGGVNVSSLVTNFATLNVMLNRHMPAHKLAVVSLEQCMPVYQEVPSKGHFFAEPLAKTGATERVQLYGEVGLKYGNEKSHGLLYGLKV